ncbi:MAG: BatD family protein [Deltaproteobacteria bacterium]|nr:BatD family protein [Deltaproteobacteria bacterium]
MRRVALLAIALLAAVGPTGIAAAEARLEFQIGSKPYYVGIPVDIHLLANEVDRNPKPICDAPPQDGGRLRLVGIQPNFSSSVQIINGRITQTSSATFTCQFQYTPDREGAHRIGPFHFKQASDEQTTKPLSIHVKSVPLDPRTRVRVAIPDEAVYIGQHLPVRIEWWLASDLQDRVKSYQLRSPFFDDADAFRFIDDEPARRGEQSLEIVTSAGTLSLAAQVEERRSGGQDYLVVAAERTMVPLRAGNFKFAASTIQVEEVTRWRRDLFGGRAAAAVSRIHARDVEQNLVIKIPPLAGRPESFAGAVGRGFSLEVSADRSVVQLGDPILLRLTVRGDGSLASVSLPRLDGPGGLQAAQFRLPDGDQPGEIVDDSKAFRVAVRVLDDSVREIPAIAYSWFDPELESYQTTHSRPIALSVRAAQVISAADVVSAIPHDGANTALSVPSRADGSEAAAPDIERRGSFALTGADLSLEDDPAILLARTANSSVRLAAAYGGSVLALLLAIALRRHGERDPAALARRETFDGQHKRITQALPQSRALAMAEIAAALREIIAAAPDLRSPEVDACIQRCDAVIYAPEDSTSSHIEPEEKLEIQTLLEQMRTRLA